MKVIKDNVWMYEGIAEGRFCFKRVEGNFKTTEYCLIDSAKYVLGKENIVLFMAFEEKNGIRKPMISYSHATLSRMTSLNKVLVSPETWLNSDRLIDDLAILG
jgi:hypothetical protein